jgi:hypothetical protein
MEPRKPNTEPDFEEDPRRKGAGEQMREEQHEEVSGGGDTHRGPAADTGGSDAPDVAVEEEGGPAQATGNPKSAGRRRRGSDR